MLVRPSIRKFCCGVALYLGVVVVGLAPTSSPAAIVFFDVDPEITIRKSLDEYVTFGDINLSTGTYTLGAYGVGWNTSFVFYGDGQWTSLGNLQLAVTGPNEAVLLNYGETHFIETVNSWASSADSYGAWASGGSGYVGVIMAAGGYYTDWYFGWMALDYVAAGSDSTLTISGFAFESEPGQPIAAGAGGPPPGPSSVPEPGTWAAAALLAGGAVLMRWRKRAKVS